MLTLFPTWVLRFKAAMPSVANKYQECLGLKENGRNSKAVQESVPRNCVVPRRVGTPRKLAEVSIRLDLFGPIRLSMLKKER